MNGIFGRLTAAPATVLAAGVLIALASLAPVARAAEFEMADQVIVDKSQRKLLLMKGDRVLKSFDVALGLVPKGHKSREGDFRTPEGQYALDRRNANSDYFLSIRVSYPNEQDKRKAARQGVDPGGQIMIHGQPNFPRHSMDYYRSQDWTDGCIAVSNADMVDIWAMTGANTPIRILP